jgi:hypothetical protein
VGGPGLWIVRYGQRRVRAREGCGRGVVLEIIQGIANGRQDTDIGQCIAAILRGASLRSGESNKGQIDEEARGKKVDEE